MTNKETIIILISFNVRFHSPLVVECFMSFFHSIMSSAKCSSNPINAKSSNIHLHVFLGLPTGLLGNLGESIRFHTDRIRCVCEE